MGLSASYDMRTMIVEIASKLESEDHHGGLSFLVCITEDMNWSTARILFHTKAKSGKKKKIKINKPNVSRCCDFLTQSGNVSWMHADCSQNEKKNTYQKQCAVLELRGD